MDEEITRQKTILQDDLDTAWGWIAKSAGLFFIAGFSYVSAIAQPNGGRFLIFLAPYALYRLVVALLNLRISKKEALKFEIFFGIRLEDELPKYLVPLAIASWPLVLIVLFVMWATV